MLTTGDHSQKRYHFLRFVIRLIIKLLFLNQSAFCIFIIDIYKYIDMKRILVISLFLINCLLIVGYCNKRKRIIFLMQMRLKLTKRFHPFP
jgi:hypothetical protein